MNRRTAPTHAVVFLVVSWNIGCNSSSGPTQPSVPTPPNNSPGAPAQPSSVPTPPNGSTPANGDPLKTQADRDPLKLQNRLLQQLRTLSSDWDNVRVEEDRGLSFLASFKRDDERYSMRTSEVIPGSGVLSAVMLILGDIDGFGSKPSGQVYIGMYINNIDKGRLEVNLNDNKMPLWDEAKMTRFLPLAEQFRQAIRDVL